MDTWGLDPWLAKAPDRYVLALAGPEYVKELPEAARRRLREPYQLARSKMAVRP